jgi:hypothetical protein
MSEEKTIEVNSDTLDTVTEKIEVAVTALSDKLGVASDHFYPILVEQHYLSGWVWIWTALPLLILACLFAGFFIKEALGDKDGEVLFPLGLIATVLYVFFGVVLASNLMSILNPEYYALMEIKSFIK